MTAQDHNKLLSTLIFILGCIQCIGLLAALAYIVIGIGLVVIAPGQPQKIMGVFFLIAGVIGLILTSLIMWLNLTTSRKLSQQLPGARTWALIVSVLCLLGFPLGTALGIYGLWFLTGDMGKQIYPVNGQVAQIPSGPQNWQ
jgi:hypothetical protein